MDHIRSVHLEGLNHIKTFTGLGSKSQIITMRDMKQLEDISALKETQNIAISRYPLLFHPNTLNYLTSVKVNLNHFIITQRTSLIRKIKWVRAVV